MFEPEKASKSSVDSGKPAEPDSAPPATSETRGEDPPSLQMLEHSAAQLAALRQRAENLLDQRPANSRIDTAPDFEQDSSQEPPSVSKEISTDPIDNTDPTDKKERELPLSGSSPYSSPAFVPFEDEITPRQPFDSDPDDHFPVFPGPSSPTPPTDDTPNFLASPQQIDNFERDPTPSVQQTEDSSPTLPNADTEIHENRRPNTYPIQKHGSQSTSMLDQPVDLPRSAPSEPAGPISPWIQTEIHKIEEEIATLFDAIDRVRETRQENTGHALSLLREARQIIATEPYRPERAALNIQRARQILDRASASRNRSRGIAFRAVGLLVIWLGGLGALGTVLFLNPLESGEIVDFTAARAGWRTVHLYPVLWAVVTGGIGGCLGTASFLVERLRVQQEFDGLYIVRATIQPLMGIVLGLVIYGLFAALFGSLGSSVTVHPTIAYLPAAFALPVGVWQVYVYALIFRLTRLLTFQRRRRW